MASLKFSSPNNTLEKKIKNLLLYKRRIHKNSTSSKILDLLYPDESYTIKQINSKIDKPYHYTKNIVLALQSGNHLDNDSKLYKRQYFLSPIGRWFAMCVKLDHISFQSLCVLAAAYSKIKRHPQKTGGYYMVSSFRDLFDESYDGDRNCISAIYSTRNITKSIKMLTDRNLVYWGFRDVLKFTSKFFDLLQKYDYDLESLADWNCKSSEKCIEEYLNSLSFDKKKRQVLALTVSSNQQLN